MLVVASSCIALTILAYAIQHGATYGPSLVRCVVSIVAIVITTFLALKSQAAAMTLREQADLLETTHDAIIVRNMNDVITFWNRGAEHLYEWSKEEAIGKVSHELLQTAFPAALGDLKSTLLHADRLEVELTHTKRDGTKVVVASRWSVQRDKSGRPIGMLETNNDITKRKAAEDALRRSEAYLAEAQILSRTGSFAWDVETGKIAWSDEAYRIFEHDRGSEPTIEYGALAYASRGSHVAARIPAKPVARAEGVERGAPRALAARRGEAHSRRGPCHKRCAGSI